MSCTQSTLRRCLVGRSVHKLRRFLDRMQDPYAEEEEDSGG